MGDPADHVLVRLPAAIRCLSSRVRRALAAERGSALLIVVLALPLMLGMAAFAIDLGTLWAARRQAQMAADAGALAGAEDVADGTTTGTTVTTDATTLVQDNDPDANQTVTAPYNSDPNSVKVVVTKQIPLKFAVVFGLPDATVSATAVATANLTTPLGYFGSDNSDLQDGSPTSDGWDNFCAADGESNSTADSDDPPRCPVSAQPGNETIDGWTVAHGGVDISLSNFYSPPGTSDQMVDLTGTCVEKEGNYPSSQASGDTSITVDGTTTQDDGYCEANADGEIEQAVTTIPHQQYSVTFELGSNTWGYPYEKTAMVLASTEDPIDLPAIADTDGNDDTSGTAAEPYGTTYPLENSSSWTNTSTIIGHEEFFYYGPAGGDTDPVWQAETFTFTAATTKTYIAFGALTNCVPDWYSSGLDDGYYYPSSIKSDSPGSVSGAWTTTSFVEPPEEVNDDNQSPWQDQCKYGPGISDIMVEGSNSESLTQ